MWFVLTLITQYLWIQGSLINWHSTWLNNLSIFFILLSLLFSFLYLFLHLRHKSSLYVEGFSHFSEWNIIVLSIVVNDVVLCLIRTNVDMLCVSRLNNTFVFMTPQVFIMALLMALLIRELCVAQQLWHFPDPVCVRHQIMLWEHCGIALDCPYLTWD